MPLILHTFHGHSLHGYFSQAQNRIFRFLEKSTAFLSDRVITLTPGLKRELVNLGVARPERISVIPLGFDLGPFACQKRRPGIFRQELGLTDNICLLGTVGRLVVIKNIPLLLKAGAQLKELGIDAHIAIIGDGEERQFLEELSRNLKIKDIVSFTGWRHDLPEIFADLDIAVMTSDNEGTPVSLIESMAAGCPVIATGVGGVPDLLEGGRLGLLVPPRSVEDLVSAIIYLIRTRDETLKRARTAQERVLEQYTLERLVNDMDNLYQELLGERVDKRQ